MYVMLDDELPCAVETPQPELVAAQERIRDLEGQVELLQRQLQQERQHNAELVKELKAATFQEQWNPRWRFWRRKG